MDQDCCQQWAFPDGRRNAQRNEPRRRASRLKMTFGRLKTTLKSTRKALTLRLLDVGKRLGDALMGTMKQGDGDEGEEEVEKSRGRRGRESDSQPEGRESSHDDVTVQWSNESRFL
ncbi:hypothetical protein CLOM_g22028 [Closterium sp. NIES-68]|nr:hypothetical protein CLOM_g22028 [Closterium sp. NIES-68]GJP77791.1 hypothetical protein CLOP_g8135 [Closterium sp. NIES-67]